MQRGQVFFFFLTGMHLTLSLRSAQPQTQREEKQGGQTQACSAFITEA